MTAKVDRGFRRYNEGNVYRLGDEVCRELVAQKVAVYVGDPPDGRPVGVLGPIDFLVSKGTHYLDHLVPIWEALPAEARGRFLVRQDLAGYAKSLGIEPIRFGSTAQAQNILREGKGFVVLCGHADPQITDPTGRKNVIVMHGVGFNFDANHELAAYPGTSRNRSNTVLMLATSKRIAEIERAGNPKINVVTVGCPRMDRLHRGLQIADFRLQIGGSKAASSRRTPKPVVALAWHWNCGIAPETRTAWPHFKAALPDLAGRFEVLGHGHPRIIEELATEYERMGIEVVRSLDEVFERADLLIGDATSAIYEFASLDRPVVVLNAPWYRRDVNFGLRFWDHADVGINVDDPGELVAAVEEALADSPEQAEKRRAAVAYAYAYTDGRCAERAAAAIMKASGLQTREEASGVTNPGRSEARVSEKRMAELGWKLTARPPDPLEWPDVVIVVPVYNSPKLLGQCITSLARTEYPGQVRFAFVDNASSDPETLAILRSIQEESAARGEDWRPVRFASPVGFAEAVNAGMRSSPGADYYVLFNQDCRVKYPSWLIHLIRWMESRPECAIAGPKLLYEDGLVQHAGIDMVKGHCCRHRKLRAKPDDPEVNDHRKVAAVTGAAMCIRASVVDEVGHLDESYRFGCEDLEYCLRAAAQVGKEVWYVPTSIVEHQDHGVRKSNPQDSRRIRDWAAESDRRFRSEWGNYIDMVAAGSVAFVLPDFNPAAGGCRVVAGIANHFANCGVKTTVYLMRNAECGMRNADWDLPQLYEMAPLSHSARADIVIATRFDTVEVAKRIPAAKRFYLVQQIETVMAKYCGGTEQEALESYQDKGFDLITIGEHLAEHLRAMGRECRVLDVGFYRDLYPYRDRQAPHSPFRVLMYACRADYKGAGDLSLIAAEIRKRLPGVEINSFHRNQEKPEWADKHWQPQSTSEVAWVYADHDVYVYASHSDGFAMTPVEAMACGTPVVLTDFPGKDQYAECGDPGNCEIVDFRDVEGVGETVTRLSGDLGRWLTLSENGAATADRYDWSKVGRQYANAILGAPV